MDESIRGFQGCGSDTSISRNEIFGKAPLAQQERDVRGSCPGGGGAQARTSLLFVKITQKACGEFTKLGGRGQEGELAQGESLEIARGGSGNRNAPGTASL